MGVLKHPLAALVALVLAATAGGVALLSDEGEGSRISLSDLRVVGAAEGEPLLFPDFRPDLDSYVARCRTPRLELALRAPAGVQATVAGGNPIEGAARTSVPVKPGHDFAIHVEDDGSGSTYRVRCLPRGFPDWDYESLRPGGDGLFMVTFPTTHWLIVFDQDGVPRWWYRSPERTLGGQITPRGTVLWSRSFGDGYGLNPQMAHEEHRLDGSLIRVIRTHGAVIDAHEHYAFEDGSAYVDSYVPRYPVDLSRFGGPRRAAVVDNEIEQLDPEGNLIWRWTSLGRIPLSETTRWWETIFQIGKPGPAGLPIYDPIHINTIEPWGDQLVTSFRHLDALYGIDRRSGDILWKLGGTPRPESLRVVGDRYAEPFGGQHDSRIWGENLLSVYDNSVRLGRPPRGVLFRLEPEEGRATFIRQFTDPTIPASRCCGSMRPFAGGWLIGWGDTDWVTAFDEEGRITFRIRVPGRSYRAVPVLPGQATLEDLERGLEAMEDPGAPGEAAEDEDGPPVALLIHGGSWLRGGPPAMDIPARIAADLGFQPVKVEYPLGDVEAANRTVRRLAESWRGRGRVVVAFGESAGGQIATLLAAEGRVDYAVGNAPVSNLLRYWEGDEQEFWEEELGADEATRRELSPALQPQDRPVLLLHSPKDPGVPFDLSVDYARKFPQVRLRRVGGCHILDCDDSRGYHYHRNSRIGLAWLAQRVGLSG